MTRRTKAQMRAARIADYEARLRELKREAAREEKAAFEAATADLGKWLVGEVQATSLDDIAAVREALDNPKTLESLRNKVAAITAVADNDRDDGSSDDGNGSDSAGDGEADRSEQSADMEDEPASSFKPWG